MAEHKQTVTISLEQFNHMCAELDELREYKKNSINMIEKIRAEIAEHANRLTDSLYGDGLRHALEIIDKYKGESEDKK